MIAQTAVGRGSLVLFAVDADGIFTFSEGAGLGLLGLGSGELVGRSAFDVYRGAPAVTENLRRALSGEAFSCAVEVGDAVFDCRYEPIEDGEGAVTGATGVAAYAGCSGEAQNTAGPGTSALARGGCGSASSWRALRTS
ncbi:PAS domain-containing protein [Rubrobacter marinus]|uniref:PAS domain-containing protein n=1 Tax=Rubrobacter marinus TaxID=2653852 RepID=A0A6G8Q0B0_9ACTN|nr:PAS domain-containing protein [Rubrobacter marinus]QIN79885.1 PAS domain-containing protein [Rubrobacter marinus]